MKNVFFLLISLFLIPAYAIEENMNYIKRIKDTVLPFYQTNGETIKLKSKEGINLSAIKFIHPTSKDSVVVFPGWSESYSKYLEVIYDLYQLGYTVFAYDHRGQGFSDHLVLANNNISHVDKFQDYVEDVDFFMKTVVLPEVKEKPYLLAHSMGATISLLYLQKHQEYFKAAAFSSPMLQINTKPYPSLVASGLLKILKLFGKKESYAPGKGDYDPDAKFEDNIVTHSLPRFQMAKMMNFIYPETILGGPSVNWVNESMKTTHGLRNAGAEFKLPMLIFQASADVIVRTKRQNKLCERAPNCRIEIFEGAHHEILMEKDQHRKRAFTEIAMFFKSHP